MRRIWLVLLIVLGAFAIIGYNVFAAATNESFFPLIFRLSMIPTYTPTLTSTPSPSPTPTATLVASLTPTATSTATQVGQADVVIVENAAPLKAGIDEEYVTLLNQGTGGIDLQDWVLSDEEDNFFYFPSFTLETGETVNIWTKADTNTATDLYWGRIEEVWNNDGDVVTLEDQDENEIDAFAY